MKSIIKFLEQKLHCKIFRKILPVGVDLSFDLKRLGDSETIRTILDVGANIGQSAVKFASEFPGAVVYSFEPIGQTFSELERYTQQYPNIKPFRLGLGSSVGEQIVFLSPMSVLNSLVPTLNIELDPDHNRETVVVDTLDNWCKKHSVNTVDLLKIDTEGFDLEVLKGAEGMLTAKKIRFIFTEASFEEGNPRFISLESLRDYLASYGFGILAIYDQGIDYAKGRCSAYFNVLFTKTW